MQKTMQSMTGFGSRERNIPPIGKVSVEMRSTNHKFLETVFHLPPGFLLLEEKIKKSIEAKLKRGRVTCVVNVIGANNAQVFVNKALIKKYILSLKSIKEKFHIKDELSINTLVHLPGVLSLAENKLPEERIFWQHLKALVECALDDLLKMRRKEGSALFGFLKARAEALKASLLFVENRFRKASKDRLKELKSDEERSVFLKESDIAEEIERLAFHIRNFRNKLSKAGAVGKELDFIAQEMQREANTMGAKSFDLAISAKVVQVKSQIEKIREQVQNIE